VLQLLDAKADDYSYSACLQIWFVEVCFVISLFCAIKLMVLPPQKFLNTTLEMCFEVRIQLLYEKIVNSNLRRLIIFSRPLPSYHHPHFHTSFYTIPLASNIGVWRLLLLSMQYVCTCIPHVHVTVYFAGNIFCKARVSNTRTCVDKGDKQERLQTAQISSSYTPISSCVVPLLSNFCFLVTLAISVII